MFLKFLICAGLIAQVLSLPTGTGLPNDQYSFIRLPRSAYPYKRFGYGGGYGGRYGGYPVGYGGYPVGYGGYPVGYGGYPRGYGGYPGGYSSSQAYASANSFATSGGGYPGGFGGYPSGNYATALATASAGAGSLNYG